VVGDKHQPLDAAVIFDPLDALLRATSAKLEREWPSHAPGGETSSILLRGFVEISSNVWNTMRYFCADKPPDVSRKLEYSRCAPALARVVLEALFNVTFILEDLQPRTEWFEKAGWRAMSERLERIRSAYQSDPDWTDYIGRCEAQVQTGIHALGITSSEAANPTLIPRWPLLKQMKSASPQLKSHFEYLGDWFYKSLSEDVHLSWPGFIRHSVTFLRLVDRDFTEDLQRQKIETMTVTIALLVALLSEIEIAIGVSLRTRIGYVWGLMIDHQPSRELYRRRYEGLLQGD